MSVVLTTCARDDSCDSIVDLVDIGGTGTLEFYTAGMALLLAELPFSGTAFGASSVGVATADTITPDSSANNTGTAELFVFKNGDDNAVLSGTVSATAAGGDIELNTTSINVGDSLSMSSLTVTVPEGTL
jgi:hypothetical protein